MKLLGKKPLEEKEVSLVEDGKINRAIYILSKPFKVNDKKVLAEYESSPKVNPTGSEDLYFEIPLHDTMNVPPENSKKSEEMCNSEPFPFDVMVFKTAEETLIPTNCYVVSPGSPALPEGDNLSIGKNLLETSSGKNGDSSYDNTDADPFNNSKTWVSKNSFSNLWSEKICGGEDSKINLLQGGVCESKISETPKTIEKEKPNPGYCYSYQGYGNTCKFFIADPETFGKGIQEGIKDIQPNPHIVVCESEDHLKFQEPIQLPKSAKGFAFIDGKLLFSVGEGENTVVYGIDKKMKQQSSACNEKPDYKCKKGKDCAKQPHFIIKMKNNDATDLFDIETGELYTGYDNDKDAVVIFPDPETGVRYPDLPQWPITMSNNAYAISILKDMVQNPVFYFLSPSWWLVKEQAPFEGYYKSLLEFLKNVSF